MIRIAKVHADEIIIILLKIEGYAPSTYDARLFHVDKLAGRLAD